MIQVKICGIKRKEDALLAHACGADAIGVLVGQTHASNDFISKNQAREIVRSLPPFCASVLVTHLTDVKEIQELISYIGVSCVQLHGESSLEEIASLRGSLPHIKIIKSVHVTDQASVDDAKALDGKVDAILLDSINVQTKQIGGTGKVHDWSISRKIVAACHTPVILAGGLNPENVAAAIEQVRPYGVDVNSGVKNTDGFKDKTKLCAFIQAAKKSF